MSGADGVGDDWGLPAPVPFVAGDRLSDPAWLGERIDDAGRFWRGSQRGTNATLWWYSASVVLLGPAVHALARTGQALSLLPGDLRFTLTPYGYLDRVLPSAEPVHIPGGATGFGAHLDDALARVIAPLAQAGAVPEQRLWALAADALGNRLLSERHTELAGPVAAAAKRLRPAPRYVDIATSPAGASGASEPAAGAEASGAGEPARYLRRASCCLVFRVPGQGLCISCPRQTPEERRGRLEQHARSSAGLF